jgi:prenyltransferase beta subunit
MKRNVWFLLWWVAALLSSRELYAQTSIDNGLSYLHSTQFPDGSWGGTASSTTDIIPATETIVETLRLLESAPSSQQLLGRSYLSSQTLFETDYIARRILALVGAPSFVALDQTTLLSFQNKVGGTTFVNDSGWGGLAGYGSTVLDSALALRGLAAAHFSSPNIIGPALNYLFSSQNLDGGWGFEKGQASQVYYTSLALFGPQRFSALLRCKRLGDFRNPFFGHPPECEREFWIGGRHPV